MSDVSNYQPVLGNFDSAGNLLQMWGPNGKVAYDPAAVSITGGLIGGAPIDARTVVTLPAGAASLAAAIPNTFDKLNRSRADRPFVIAIDSDSTATGQAASTFPTFPSGELLGAAHIFGCALAAAGLKINTTTWMGVQGFQSLSANNGKVDTAVTVGAGWTESIGGNIAGGGNWINSTTTNALSFYCDQDVDTAQLVYITNAAATNGTITLDVGGSALYSQSCNVAASTVCTAPIALGAPSRYTINIKKTIAGEIVAPIGVIAWNSRNPGVLVVNNAAPGKTMAQGAAHGGANGIGPAYLYAALQPDLTLIHLILNSLGATASYATDAASLIGFAQRAGAADVIFYDGPQPGAGQANVANYPTIVALAKAAASAAGCPYFSASSYLGANPNGAGNTNYLAEQIGHLTPVGYTRLYSALAQPIIAALRAA